MHLYQFVIVLLLAFCCTACSQGDDASKHRLANRFQKAEYIYRMHDERLFSIPEPEIQTLDPYPWESGHASSHPKISKEYFRCKGSSLNPVHISQEKGEVVRYYDCGGAEKHSLPLRDQKEFIYPILIELVNYIQAKTQKRVVITSGHRCPEHNLYVDSSMSNRYSKHTMGAEVSFYVQGLEENPESVIKLIQEYYKETSKYQGQKDYLEFQRYEKSDSNVATQPWFNKEIFIKLFKKKEGRNFDNRHPYPYVSLQVRHDFEKNEKVVYTWDKANNNYLRR
jgi:hypothetical protein